MFAAPALSILGTKMKCLLFQQSGGSLCLFASTEELPCLSKFSLISSAGWSRWRWQGIWPGLKGTDGWTPWPKLPTIKCLIHFLHWCDPRQTTDFAGNTYQTSSVGPHKKTYSVGLVTCNLSECTAFVGNHCFLCIYIYIYTHIKMLQFCPCDLVTAASTTNPSLFYKTCWSRCYWPIQDDIIVLVHAYCAQWGVHVFQCVSASAVLRPSWKMTVRRMFSLN